MYKLKLQNFRIWEDITFTFGSGITKIVGKSGSGKSTIFDSIQWCLYGKVRAIKPRNKKNAKTSVTLESCDSVPPFWVRREGSSLEVLVDKTTYKGDQAQDFVNRYFGTVESFRLTSYLKADEYHPLPFGSPSEKREMTALLFPESHKYSLYKERLEKMRTGYKVQFEDYRSKLSLLKGQISDMETRYDWVKEWSPTEISPIKQEEVNSLRIELRKKNNSVNQFMRINEDLGVLSIKETTSLEKSLKEKQNELRNLYSSTSDKEEIISRLTERKNEFISSINDIKKELSGFGIINIDIDGIMSESKELMNLKARCHPFTMDIELEDKKILLKEYKESFENIQNNISVKAFVTCPGCSIPLSYNPLEQDLQKYTGNATLLEVKHNITQDDIDNLVGEIYQLENHKKTYDNVSKELNNKTFSYISKDTDIDAVLALCKSYQEKNSSLDNMKKEIQIIDGIEKKFVSPEIINNLEKEISDLYSQIASIQSDNNKIATLTSRREVLLKTNPWLNESEKILSEMEEKLIQLSTNMSSNNSINQRNLLHSEYLILKEKQTKFKNSIDQVMNKLGVFASVQSIFASSYNQYVGIRLKLIQNDLSNLTKIFFSRTTNISLKAGDQTSIAKVDIVLEQDGVVIENLKHLSTGEKKRLSIVFMIILSKYLDGKIIMLDEALSSVEGERRGVIIRELERLNVTTYFTCHGSISGQSEELNVEQL